MDTLDDVIAMDWGGLRNLALRETLGLVEGEVGLVNRHRLVQVVVAGHARARKLDMQLRAGLPGGWTVDRYRRADGRYVLHGYDPATIPDGLVDALG
jgi:hypothetical protein